LETPLPAGCSQLPNEAPSVGLAQQLLAALAYHLKLCQTLHAGLLPNYWAPSYTLRITSKALDANVDIGQADEYQKRPLAERGSVKRRRRRDRWLSKS
jgi:mitochondrial fission protein ELM1